MYRLNLASRLSSAIFLLTETELCFSDIDPQVLLFINNTGIAQQFSLNSLPQYYPNSCSLLPLFSSVSLNGSTNAKHIVDSASLIWRKHPKDCREGTILSPLIQSQNEFFILHRLDCKMVTLSLIGEQILAHVTQYWWCKRYFISFAFLKEVPI